MANRDFKIELDNVEMINGSDDLLKDTKVTKVTITGDNKFNSLNSSFENCIELEAIDGDINLEGATDISEILKDTPLDEVKVINPTEETIQIADNSFYQVTNVKIGGTKYSKGGVQDVVGSLDWNAENFVYEDTILENVHTNSSYSEDSKNLTVSDTLEQKATSIEIIGQTYTNLVNGKATKNLLGEMSMQQVEGLPTQFTPHMEQPICLEYIEGNTSQDGIQSIGELIENKNLFDYTQSELGFLSIGTGGISSSTAWKYTTNLISVKPNTTYCISQASNSEFYYNIVEYNSSQSYLKGTSWEVNNGAISNRVYNTFTTSSNTYYIRLNWKVSSSEIQLEEGLIPTEFRVFGSERYKIEIETYDSRWDSI